MGKPTMIESKLHQTFTKKETKEYEAKLEAYLVKRIKELQLDERKLNPNACKGIPDRIVFDPLGRYIPRFVEVKRDKKAKVHDMQVYLARGLNTTIISSKEEAEKFLYNYFNHHYNTHEMKINEFERNSRVKT